MTMDTDSRGTEILAELRSLETNIRNFRELAEAKDVLISLTLPILKHQLKEFFDVDSLVLVPRGIGTYSINSLVIICYDLRDNFYARDFFISPSTTTIDKIVSQANFYVRSFKIDRLLNNLGYREIVCQR